MTTDVEAEIVTRLRAVDWATLDTAYGPATRVPEWLWGLRFGSPPVADDSGNMLYGALCHQKGQLASAAEFALPFLLEFLPHVPSLLQIEVLDILHGMALCSSPRLGYPSSVYHDSIRRRLIAGVPQIAPFSDHESEDARYFASEILAELSTP